VAHLRWWPGGGELRPAAVLYIFIK